MPYMDPMGFLTGEICRSFPGNRSFPTPLRRLEKAVSQSLRRTMPGQIRARPNGPNGSQKNGNLGIFFQIYPYKVGSLPAITGFITTLTRAIRTASHL